MKNFLEVLAKIKQGLRYAKTATILLNHLNNAVEEIESNILGKTKETAK